MDRKVPGEPGRLIVDNASRDDELLLNRTRLLTRILMSTSLFSLLAILTIAFTSIASAQSANELIERSAGTTYVVAFPDTVKNTFDPRYPNTR
ncbi:MAG: hypothetical protein H7X80_11830, partial [bacterium]|nr:hypothetical protein [Candidatus Kapabacteria bacterium]